MRHLEAYAFFLLGASACVSVAGVNFFMSILLLFFFVRLATRRYEGAPADWFFLGFVLWNMFISLLTPQPAVSMEGLGDYWAWMAYFAGAGLSQKARRRVPEFARYLALSVIITLPFSLAAVWLGTDLRLQRLISKLPPGTIPGKGVFGHHLTYAGVMSVAAFFLLGMALYSKNKGRISGWCGAAGGAVGLLTSLGRGYWLSTIPAGLVIIRKKGLRWVIAAVLIGAILLSLLLTLGPAGLRDRAFSIFDLENPSNVERIYLWKSALEMIAERPLTGWGPDMYELVCLPYKAPYQRFIHYPDREGFRTHGHCHSLYLQVAFDSGLVGLALFLAFVTAALLRVYRQPHEGVRWGVLAAWTAFLAGGVFEFNGGDAEVASLAFFLLGLGSRDIAEEAPGETPPSSKA